MTVPFFKRKSVRRILFILPLILLPFLTFTVFYVLGIIIAFIYLRSIKNTSNIHVLVLSVLWPVEWIKNISISSTRKFEEQKEKEQLKRAMSVDEDELSIDNNNNDESSVDEENVPLVKEAER